MILTVNVLLQAQQPSGLFATGDEASNVGDCFNDRHGITTQKTWSVVSRIISKFVENWSAHDLEKREEDA